MTINSQRQAFRKSLTWGKRLILVVLILGGFGYLVLSMAARSPEPIRLGLQDYIKEASGHDAQITDLAKVKLVPNLSLEARGILIRDAVEGKSLLKAGRVAVGMPFLSILLGSPKYHSFEAEKIEIASGFFLPQKLSLAFAGISSENAELGEAYFMAEGEYNALPLLFTANMFMNSRGKKPLFYFSNEIPVSLKLGKTELSGTYTRTWDGVALNGVEARHENEFVMFDVRDIKQNPFSASFTGDYNGQAFTGSILQEQNILTLSLRIKSPEDFERFLIPVLKDFALFEREDLLKLDIRQE